eukprot:CAMPEP_0182891318 /NCGR_PEP_ID=MMETSP0034_2-20130328/23181_1 /TAXON_ID=156128 /ORGANISM="Nephroselmis pyriformis, Strain CCMP717" /LENGTH=55 /DNA_ID=CAMNT_0025024919 /DNA_START=215 /DNA_END=380 /DNA_ORIENTATION=-
MTADPIESAASQAARPSSPPRTPRPSQRSATAVRVALHHAERRFLHALLYRKMTN